MRRADKRLHRVADRDPVGKKGRGDPVAPAGPTLVADGRNRKMDLTGHVLRRGGNRVKAGLQRVERRDQLGERRAGRRESLQQVEEIGILRAGAGVTLCHRLQNRGFVGVEGARGQHLDGLIRWPADFAALGERLDEGALDPVGRQHRSLGFRAEALDNRRDELGRIVRNHAEAVADLVIRYAVLTRKDDVPRLFFRSGMVQAIGTAEFRRKGLVR